MDNKQWIQVDESNIHKLNKGMLVRGNTSTWSQLWTIKPGYETCNCTIYGTIVSEDNKDIYDIKVKKICVQYYVQPEYDMLNDECDLLYDVGSSGVNAVYIFVGTEEEQTQEMNGLMNK